ncbi:hypothetical protein KIN20_032662 [Parelaphostrongylus tenuis]|uniref:Uncharacterized protein n=1 Tax=Parelaphostrongylus tenuis TaxID=148309 RepID=A0AAD5R7J5_PARTN|nr:hypothetical protein KIN20_032662 [Parelaphostrongylus tenuis]
MDRVDHPPRGRTTMGDRLKSSASKKMKRVDSSAEPNFNDNSTLQIPPHKKIAVDKLDKLLSSLTFRTLERLKIWSVVHSQVHGVPDFILMFAAAYFGGAF